MLVAVITLSVLLAVAIWLLIIQFRKSEKLMAYLELYVRMLSVIALRTNRAYKRMKDVDRLGSFEADDETGFIFKEIKEATTDLDEFVKKYISNDAEEKENEKE
jgi:hypothetical protein|tara:strand:+ start:4010 stop:4321 length:312 start_codon:yes stop_codon:yes gene_type:complete